MSFQAKIYKINMYLLMYLSFKNHNAGIHPTATEKCDHSNTNGIYIVCDVIMTSDIIIGSIVMP